jgi:transketolase
VPILNRQEMAPASGLQNGGYVLWDSSMVKPEIVFIATGSEVSLALAAARILAAQAIRVRVVSMPSWERFDAQTEEYRCRVLPPTVRTRVAVEAGISLGWEHYVGLDGAVIALDRFGASAPFGVLCEEFGFTAEQIAQKAKDLIG